MKLNGMFIFTGFVYFSFIWTFFPRSLATLEYDPYYNYYYYDYYYVLEGNYTMMCIFNFLWGLTQIVPFLLGMRLLLVTRHSNKFTITSNPSTFNKFWWGIAASYIAVIFLCMLINMCMNPGGNDKFDWYDFSGARVAFAKIFQTFAFLINAMGTILVCIGIHWFNVHRRTRLVPKGGCYAGLYIYYVIWQCIYTVFVLLAVILLDTTTSWLPSTIAGMSFMNLPFLSAMSGSDSFSDIFGKSADFYFMPEQDQALMDRHPQAGFA